MGACTPPPHFFSSSGMSHSMLCQATCWGIFPHYFIVPLSLQSIPTEKPEIRSVIWGYVHGEIVLTAAIVSYKVSKLTGPDYQQELTTTCNAIVAKCLGGQLAAGVRCC